MKRLYILIFYLSVLKVVTAQLSIQNNATWYYYWDNQFQFGTIKTKYVSDTIISGYNSKKFVSRKYIFTGNPNNVYTFLDSSELRIDYTFSNQDTLFWWDGSSFQLVLDYSTQIGETRSSIFFDNSGFPFCDSISTFETESIDELNLGQNYRTISISSPYSSPFRLNGEYNERIGAIEENNNYSWLFPTQGWCSAGDTNQIPEESPYYSFRCFQDDSLFYNPSGIDCEYHLNNLSNQKAKLNEIKFFPNPIHTHMTLILENEQSTYVKIEILTMDNRVLYSNDIVYKTTTLDLSFLKSGLYTLMIKLGNDQIITRKIIKN